MDIRLVKKEELQFVYNLVVQLAIFEKEPDAVTASLEDYLKAYDEGVYDVLVAEENGEIIGIALHYMTFSTWKGKMMYLEDLYVDENHRGKGVGQKLFDAYIKASKDQGCNLVKWQVLDWNEGAIRFYKRNNATIEQEWYNGKIIF